MKKILIVMLMFILVNAGCAEKSPAGDSSILNSYTHADSSVEASTQSTSNTASTDDEILEESRKLFVNEYAIMDEYDIDEAQKLATILIASYLDMQVRVDIEGIISLNPVFEETLADEETRNAFILDLLQCSDFQLFAVEDAEMKNASITFNVAYQFYYGENDLSMLFRQFSYQWEEGEWRYYGDTDADSAAARKPNFFLVLSKKGEASAEIFGTDNLLTLFDFGGESYREAYQDS